MRDIHSIIIWIAVFSWAGFTVLAVEEMGIDAWLAVGFGAVGGFLLKMLGDMWQFYFRKRETKQ